DAIKSKGHKFNDLFNQNIEVVKPKIVSDTITLLVDPTTTTKTYIQRDKVKKLVDLKIRLKSLEEGKILNISNIDKNGAKTSAGKDTGRKDMFRTKAGKIMTNNIEALITFSEIYTKLHPNDHKAIDKF